MKIRTWLLAGALTLVGATSAWGWLEKGHEKATALAVGLAGDMPAFFRDGQDVIVAAVPDPDSFTRPIAGPALHGTESPEHFFDLEVIEGLKIPPSRQEFLDQIHRKEIKVGQVGTLPYAVAEWTEKLAIALAEHRKWPQNKAIQAKCLVYAGLLAHYAEDLCQPLHTTIDYDGRAAGGKSPRSGIHLKVDSLLGRVGPDTRKKSIAPQIDPLFDLDKALAAAATASAPATTSSSRPVPAMARFETPLFEAIMAQLYASHELVEFVYKLEADLPANEQAELSDKAERFAQDRLSAAAVFTARLYVTAWRMSEHIALPEWLGKDRAGRP
jgi:hypothetical protein